MSESERVPLYSWMRPAWWLGRLRPGLRAASAADAARLRELPPVLGGVILPVLAVAPPLLLSVGHAMTIPWTAPNPAPSPAVLIIHDVFTESIPFMLVSGLVGLASPAAGVLVALTYAVGDFGATVWSTELKPPVQATFGRLVTYLVLWLLVVEIPLLGRAVFEWWSSHDGAARRKRVAALVASALSVSALTYIWALGAPLLVVIVFRPMWPSPPALPATVMVTYDGMLAIALGIAALAILGVRYLGSRARVGRSQDEPARPAGPASPAAYLGGLALTLLILSSVLRKPVDALILLAGLLLARPIARGVLRVTRLAPLLAGIAWPIRLIAGFGFALMFAWYFIAIAGVSLISPFFNMVIAIAVGFIILELFLAADDVVAAPRDGRGGVAAGVRIGAVLSLTLPAVALADNFSDQGDMPSAAAAAAAAAGAAGAAAFPRRSPNLKEYSGPPGQESGGPGHGGGPPKTPGPYTGPGGHESSGPPKLKEFTPPGAPPPNPPPWWMPDGFGPFFGYD